MSPDTSQPARIRAFVALDLPAAVRSGIDTWGAAELGDEALRPVPAENLHLTLCFLGHIPPGDVERAAEIVLSVRPRPVPVTLGAEPVAKPRGRPRLFALDVDSPAAIELQAELSRALSDAALYEPDARPFWPHLTVARVRTEPGRRKRPRRVRIGPGELPPALVHTFASVRVALYRSNLRPGGSQYEPLANLDLPPTG
jgi:RNA 2',3'-cyclic 3'-phosphodiesterase